MASHCVIGDSGPSHLHISRDARNHEIFMFEKDGTDELRRLSDTTFVTKIIQRMIFTSLKDFHQRHERLKKAVHEGFRYPLPKWGRITMGFVYMTIPIIGGYFVMQWAISKSHESIGEYGERLPVKEVQGIGDKHVNEDGRIAPIGAGGWGGGVRLAVSDHETQQKNKKKLALLLKHQKRREEAGK